MHLNLSGFLKDSSEDDSLKFRYGFETSMNESVLAAMGWESMQENADGEQELTHEQITMIEKVANLTLPKDLRFYLSVRGGYPVIIRQSKS